MAGREKKPALIKKQNISATLKDVDNQQDASTGKTTPVKSGAPKLEAATSQAASSASKPSARAKNAKPTTKALKKNIKIKFKAKAKQKGKKLKLSKSLFKSKKVLDQKNVTIVKNGIKKRGRQPKAKTQASDNDKELPPVLEPMTTIPPSETKSPKKETKKRTKKQPADDPTENVMPIIDTKKMKIEVEDKETVEDVLNDVANELQLDLELLLKKPAKKIRVTKKPIKPAVKQKKPPTPKKPKAEPKGKKTANKKMIIETLSKDFDMDSDAQNVINKLDLNVSKTMKKNIKKRRHSIEKFNSVDQESPFEPPFSIFTNLRGSASPRSKRNARIRQSIETVVNKRYSPYSTKSEPPSRILRNGKHRKLKGHQLLEGIENEYKRRRRLCSEVSTNDITKFSDYLSESDSNYSDMTNVTENGTDDIKEEGVMTKSDLLRKEILESITSPSAEELQNLNIKQISTKFTAILKRSLSTETAQLTQENIEDVKPKEELNIAFTDTNSNDLKPTVKTEAGELVPTSTEIKNKEEKTEITLEPIKIEKVDIDEKIAPSPSYKVPEKLFILDQMKQTFNDGGESPENTTPGQPKRTTRSAAKRTLKLSTSEDTAEVQPKTEETNEQIEETPEVATKEEKTSETSEETTKPEENVDLNENQCDAEKILSIEVTTQIDNLLEEIQTAEEEKLLTVENTENNEAAPTEVEEKVPEPLEEENIPDITVQEETQPEIPQEELLPEILPQEDAIPEIPEQEDKIPEIPAQGVDIPELPLQIEDIPPEKDVESEEKMEIEELPAITETNMESEEITKPMVDLHEDLINKLRGNSALSISIKETPTEFKSKSGSESGESINGIVMENMVNEAIKKLDEEKCEEISMDSMEEIKEQTPETNSVKSTEEDALPKEDNEEAIVESPEDLAIKENILNALGLRSLKAAEEAKLLEKQKPVKNDVYTGTLKTVIKLNRSVDKKKSKERNPLKMTLQKSKGRSSKDGDCDSMKFDGASKYDGENACYKVMKETSSSSTSRHSSETVGANRKTHYSNRSNLEGEQQSDNDNGTTVEGEPVVKELVIPEKASSFSIHPGRLCSDECAYCFGKFGLFDTPLHIAQIKSVERQNKILENEVYLTRDSCLCDACYRHVDRRSTGACPSKNMGKRSGNSAPHVPRSNYCHVINCDRESSNVLRRKWLLKMRKSVAKLLNIDLDNPSLHSIPVCSEHYTAVEHLMVCALCKRRLTRNHIHYLASECETLNAALEKEGIPVQLADKPLVCKLCRYFSSLLLKPPPSDSQSNTAEFFRQYKKRLLQCYDIEIPEEEDTTEQSSTKEKSDKEKKKKSSKSKSKISINNSSGSNAPNQTESDKSDQARVPFNPENGESRESSPSAVIDYETLVPNLSLECSDTDEKTEVPQKLYRKLQIPESVREAVEISKIMKYKKSNLIERLGSNPSISVRQLFQGEEDLPLFANIDFNAKEKTPEGWEKSTCTIQYDSDTKQLWQELQKPYGNQSSFLRHLILLEKYFRNGDLTLAPSASHHAVNYSVSVQNRLRAYDNIPSSSVPMQPLTMLPFNQVKKSQSGIITTRDATLSAAMNAANLPKNTPIPISQLNQNLLSQLSVRPKPHSIPPGLISISSKPKTQKMKVAVGKNWKPTLIPVTSATTAADRRVSGLVQVISGGKPYHISLQDYNKMCYLKKNQEMRKKNEGPVSITPSMKPAVPRKQLKTAPYVKESETTATITSIGADKGLQLEGKSPPKSIMILPKIPKSLTVIPQTVSRKLARPQSPTLSIITKPSTSRS